MICLLHFRKKVVKPKSWSISIQKSFLTAIIACFPKSSKILHLAGITWSQIPFGDHTLVEHHVEGKQLAHIHKKVEEGKNLMFSSNRTLIKWLGQSDIMVPPASNAFPMAGHYMTWLHTLSWLFKPYTSLGCNNNWCDSSDTQEESST